MAVPNPQVKFTYQDYRSTSDDERYELIDGELIRMAPAPNTQHQRLVLRISKFIDEFVAVEGLGEVFVSPVDVVLSDSDVVQPDLLFVSNERAYLVTELNIRGAPDLVVEIISPSSSGRDRNVKRALYARYGVGEYWLVDPEPGTVTVLLLADQGYELVGIYGEGQELTSPTLPGLTLNLDDIL